MKNLKKLSFIEDDYSFDEAHEILMTLLSSKINYYKIKNWTANQRFGKTDDIALKRIETLNNEMRELEEILIEAKVNNTKLSVNSAINISLK